MIKSIIFIFLLTFSTVFSYINIHPVEFNKKIDDQGGLVEYTLYNRMNRTVRYNISLSDSKDKSMKDWGEVYPTTLTLKPGEEKTVKLFIKAPKNTPSGEYSAILNIKEMEFPNIDKIKSKNTNLIVLTNLTIEILGYVGKDRKSVV